MRSDGSIIIDTKILDGGMEKGFEAIKDEMQSVGVTAKQVGNQIALSFSKADVSKPIANAAAKVRSLESQLAAVTADLNLAKAENDDKSAERLAARQIRLYDQLEAAREKLAIEVSDAARKQAAAEQKAAEKAAKAAKKAAAEEEKAAKKKLAAATKGINRFGTRLGSIVSGALVFNLISAGLKNVTEYFGKALKTNDEYARSVAKLKAALLTAFQPIYEFVVPLLIKLLDIATKVSQAIAHVFSTLAGKSSGQMAKNAEALYNQAQATEKVGNAAKKAQKQLAGFDEIQKISANTNDSASKNVITPDFSEFAQEDYQSKIEEVVVWTSLALLGLGAVLAFSGINIPLGIALMALGAAGLATEIATNWNAVKDALDGQAGLIFGIISGAFLVLGAILAFSGANIPLGIGLMAFGAIGLGTTVAANWNTISNALKGPIGGIVAIVSGALLVLGAVLAFTGAALPLGIGLMVSGAAGLATTAALNWDIVKVKINAVLAGILAILSGAGIVLGILLCLTGVGLGLGLALIFAGLKGTQAAWNLDDNPVTRFVKNMANGIIGIVNKVIDAVNSLFHIKFKGLNIGGVQIIPEINTKLISIPKIPLLAQGAVIPPNKEFMAILGDQRHGTNIEAPLSTIQEAVALVMQDFAAENMAGHEATVGVLRQILSAVLGIEIGDDVIGRAAARYNTEKAIAEGGRW